MLTRINIHPSAVVFVDDRRCCPSLDTEERATAAVVVALSSPHDSAFRSCNPRFDPIVGTEVLRACSFPQKGVDVRI